MAGKMKNFLDRDGRFFSRIAVPKYLRPYTDVPETVTFDPPPEGRCWVPHHPCHRVDFIFQIITCWRRESGAGRDGNNAHRKAIGDDRLFNTLHRHKNPLFVLFLFYIRENTLNCQG